MPADPDDDLLLRSTMRDVGAWDRLFSRVADHARFYVRARLGARLRDEMDSMDVLQEAYLEAWRALPDWQGRKSGAAAFRPWLCRIIENVIRGAADRQQAAKRMPPGEAEPVSRVTDLMRTSPASGAARTDERERLLVALDRLPDEQRHALVARYYRQVTIDEIAVELDRSPTAIRRLLGRALKAVGDRF